MFTLFCSRALFLLATSVIKYLPIINIWKIIWKYIAMSNPLFVQKMAVQNLSGKIAISVIKPQKNAKRNTIFQASQGSDQAQKSPYRRETLLVSFLSIYDGISNRIVILYALDFFFWIYYIYMSVPDVPCAAKDFLPLPIWVNTKHYTQVWTS